MVPLSGVRCCSATAVEQSAICCCACYGQFDLLHLMTGFTDSHHVRGGLVSGTLCVDVLCVGGSFVTHLFQQ